MQGTHDMIEREKYRRRYRDLSTVARERGRELKPEEIAGRTGKSGLPLTKEEIEQNVPSHIGGGRVSAAYKYLKDNSRRYFQAVTSAHGGFNPFPNIEKDRFSQIDAILKRSVKGAVCTYSKSDAKTIAQLARPGQPINC